MATTDVDDDSATDDADESTRLEDSRRGRILVSVFIVAILVGLLGANMPDSVLKADLSTVTQPFLNVTGLDQAWGVFAPNPPRETNDVSARVDHADGTVAIYDIPATSGISEYWTYRWRKYGEMLRSGHDPERAAYARWVADQDRDAGGRPVLVTLVRRAEGLTPPGPQPDTTPARDIPFFTLAVAP